MDFPRVAVNAGPARVFVKQWLDSPLAFFMKAMYALFRTCRLVALKRKKDSQKPTAPPGSASGSRWAKQYRADKEPVAGSVNPLPTETPATRGVVPTAFATHDPRAIVAIVYITRAITVIATVTKHHH